TQCVRERNVWRGGQHALPPCSYTGVEVMRHDACPRHLDPTERASSAAPMKIEEQRLSRVVMDAEAGVLNEIMRFQKGEAILGKLVQQRLPCCRREGCIEPLPGPIRIGKQGATSVGA